MLVHYGASGCWYAMEYLDVGTYGVSGCCYVMEHLDVGTLWSVWMLSSMELVGDNIQRSKQTLLHTSQIAG